MVAGLVFCTLLVLAPSVQAQDYPNHAVKIIVPFPPGGTADGMPRIVGDWLARKWGQAVIIENKSGAAGNVGADEFDGIGEHRSSGGWRMTSV